jgi:RsiW-degrading membrane proteinase PrsW (M82 family)
MMKARIPSDIIPFLEETSKFITLTVSPLCGVYWTLMFGMEEGLSYILKYKEKAGLVPMIIIRTIALMYHFFLLGIQYYGLKEYRKTGKFIYRFIYFGLAVMFHYFYNSGGAILILYYIVEPVLNLVSISLARG